MDETKTVLPTRGKKVNSERVAGHVGIKGNVGLHPVCECVEVALVNIIPRPITWKSELYHKKSLHTYSIWNKSSSVASIALRQIAFASEMIRCTSKVFVLHYSLLWEGTFCLLLNSQSMFIILSKLRQRLIILSRIAIGRPRKVHFRIVQFAVIWPISLKHQNRLHDQFSYAYISLTATASSHWNYISTSVPWQYEAHTSIGLFLKTKEK